MLNRCIIQGRLTHDPELKTTGSGLPFCSFRIACERDFKDKETGQKVTDFFSVQTWRNTAEFVSRFLSKGRLVAVEGRLQVREYQGRDGTKRTATEIVADNVYFCDSQRDSGGHANVATEATFEELPDDDGDVPF